MEILLVILGIIFWFWIINFGWMFCKKSFRNLKEELNKPNDEWRKTKEELVKTKEALKKLWKK